MGRIAVIDNTVDILEMLEVILRGEHDIATFSNPAMFLNQYRRARFDVIVVDIVMPDVSGYEVLYEVRAQDPDIPVVAVSAKAEASERAKALQSGFTDFFTKPIQEILEFRNSIYARVRNSANGSST